VSDGDPFFPFHAAGLSGNPFRVLPDDELRRIAVLPAPVLAALDDPAAPHVQLLGDAGRGKSTTLLAAAARLERAGHTVGVEYLPVGTTRFTTDPSGLDVFCLDEVQRLGRWERRRLRHVAGWCRLLLGSHEDMTPLLARASRAVVTVCVGGLGPDHCRAVLAARIAYAALLGRETDHATLAPDALDWLTVRFGSDLRGAERFLYEVFQASVRTPEPVTAARLAAALARCP
jgi:chromosomal replication initiation ATPase DnaA